MSAEIDEYPSLRFQDIRKKKQRRGRTHGRTYGRTDNVKTIYTPQTMFTGINKTNSSETEAPFLDLHLSI